MAAATGRPASASKTNIQNQARRKSDEVTPLFERRAFRRTTFTNGSGAVAYFEQSALDEVARPVGVTEGQRRRRRNCVIQPQIKAGAVVKCVQHGVQGQRGLDVAWQERQGDRRQRLPDRERIELCPWPFRTSTDQHLVIAGDRRQRQRHRLTGAEQVHLDEVRQGPEDLITFMEVIATPLAVQDAPDRAAC